MENFDGIQLVVLTKQIYLVSIEIHMFCFATFTTEIKQTFLEENHFYLNRYLLRYNEIRAHHITN